MVYAKALAVELENRFSVCPGQGDFENACTLTLDLS